NALNMKLFNDVLESQGYRVLQANEGGIVFNIVREHRPDLIIMDIQLPDISGLDVTKQLKNDESLREIPRRLASCRIGIRSRCSVRPSVTRRKKRSATECRLTLPTLAPRACRCNRKARASSAPSAPGGLRTCSVQRRTAVM